MSPKKPRLPKGREEIVSVEAVGTYIPEGHKPPEPDRPPVEPALDQDRLVMLPIRDYPHIANLRCPYCGRQRFTRFVDKVRHETEDDGTVKRIVETVEKEYTIRRGVAITERLARDEVPGRLRLYCRTCRDDEGNMVPAERTDLLAVREVVRPVKKTAKTETREDG